VATALRTVALGRLTAAQGRAKSDLAAIESRGILCSPELFLTPSDLPGFDGCDFLLEPFAE
jgi:hypothetical protein